MEPGEYSNDDPRQHAANMQRMLQEVLMNCRENADRFDDPKAQALCCVSAEVLIGLKTAWYHYEMRGECSLLGQPHLAQAG